MSGHGAEFEGKFTIIVDYPNLDVRTRANKPVATFAIKHLRKFSQKKDLFIFMCGSRCKPYEGWYAFTVEEGGDISAFIRGVMAERMSERSSKSSKSSSSTASSSSARTTSTTLSSVSTRSMEDAASNPVLRDYLKAAAPLSPAQDVGSTSPKTPLGSPKLLNGILQIGRSSASSVDVDSPDYLKIKAKGSLASMDKLLDEENSGARKKNRKQQGADKENQGADSPLIKSPPVKTRTPKANQRLRDGKPEDKEHEDTYDFANAPINAYLEPTPRSLRSNSSSSSSIFLTSDQIRSAKMAASALDMVSPSKQPKEVLYDFATHPGMQTHDKSAAAAAEGRHGDEIITYDFASPITVPAISRPAHEVKDVTYDFASPDAIPFELEDNTEFSEDPEDAVPEAVEKDAHPASARSTRGALPSQVSSGSPSLEYAFNNSSERGISLKEEDAAARDKLIDAKGESPAERAARGLSPVGSEEACALDRPSKTDGREDLGDLSVLEVVKEASFLGENEGDVSLTDDDSILLVEHAITSFSVIESTKVGSAVVVKKAELRKHPTDAEIKLAVSKTASREHIMALAASKPLMGPAQASTHRIILSEVLRNAASCKDLHNIPSRDLHNIPSKDAAAGGVQVAPSSTPRSPTSPRKQSQNDSAPASSPRKQSQADSHDSSPSSSPKGWRKFIPNVLRKQSITTPGAQEEPPIPPPRPESSLSPPSRRTSGAPQYHDADNELYVQPNARLNLSTECILEEDETPHTYVDVQGPTLDEPGHAGAQTQPQPHEQAQVLSSIISELQIS